jgi:hypothetical protein
MGTVNRGGSAPRPYEPDNVLQVGSGGRIASIADAIAELSSRPATKTTKTVTGSATATQFSDRVAFTSGDPRTAGVKPGDFLYVPDDAQTLGYGEHYYYVLGVFADAVILETCIMGATQTLTDPVFYRLNKYAIELLPGENEIPSGLILPDGYHVGFIGHGDSSVVTGYSMESPAWGFLEFSRLFTNSGLVTGYTKNTFPLLFAAMPTVRVHDMTMGVDATLSGAPNMEFLDGVQPSGLHVTNFHYLNVIDHGFKMYADSIFVDGFSAYMGEESYECLQMGLTNRPSVKMKSLKNLLLNRRADGAPGTVGMIIINAANGAASQVVSPEYRFSNVFARDLSTGGPVIEINGSNTGAGVAAARVYLSNCQMESGGFTSEIDSAGTAVTVYLDRCFRQGGTAVRTSGTSTFTTL